jgi:hypothetical protein
MVTPGDPALRFPFSVTFDPSTTGSRMVRTGGFITITGTPLPGVVIGVTGCVGEMEGSPTETYVVPVIFCPSDCRAAIEIV